MLHRQETSHRQHEARKLSQEVANPSRTRFRKLHQEGIEPIVIFPSKNMIGLRWLLKVYRKFRTNGPIRLKGLRKTSMEERTRGLR
jgi:hypothetical protein